MPRVAKKEVKKAEKKCVCAVKSDVNGTATYPSAKPAVISSEIVPFGDWEKLDIRVGEIETVEEILGADKLYKLTVNIGSETRVVCAGLKQYYSHDDLKGKKVIFFANLAPRMMRGINSQGMVLAAVSPDEKEVTLIEPAANARVGSRIR